MVNFSSFFTSMLTSFANFLWSEPMRWIVGIILLLGTINAIKKIMT